MDIMFVVLRTMEPEEPPIVDEWIRHQSRIWSSVGAVFANMVVVVVAVVVSIVVVAVVAVEEMVDAWDDGLEVLGISSCI